jgi:hypothetical protein
VKTKRKWKDVNHGNWYTYRLTQIELEKYLSLSVSDLHETAPGTLRMTVTARSRMQAFARYSRWRYGVQTISLSLDAEAEVATRLECQIATRLDFTHWPPDLIIVPTVARTDLEVPRFDVRRISQLHGDVADELGDQLHRLLQRRLAEIQGELPARLNRQLQKKPDRLRLSLHDWVSESWQDWLTRPALTR